MVLQPLVINLVSLGVYQQPHSATSCLAVATLYYLPEDVNIKTHGSESRGQVK